MMKKTLLIITTISTGYYIYKQIKEKKLREALKKYLFQDLNWKPKERKEIIDELKNKKFDLLIVGGGSTGVGCALDAVTRGLSVALVEMGDFGCETSSKSTKLIHGGIKYLKQVITDFNFSNLLFVKLTLNEKNILKYISPYLTKETKFILPLYSDKKCPLFIFLLRIYNWMSGKSTEFITKEKLIKIYPEINTEKIIGGVILYEYQQDDARNCLYIGLTSQYYGASVCNYVKVNAIIERNNKIVGAECQDIYTGDVFFIETKGMINATGPFVDAFLKKNKETEKIMSPSKGIHIVLPKEYTPRNYGIVDFVDTNNNILFMLPYKNKTLIGTTEKYTDLNDKKVSKEEVNTLIKRLRCLIKYKGTIEKDVSAAFSGLRPTLQNDESRDFKILVGKNKLLTITGGKWTLYRKMAEDTIDTAIRIFNLKPENQCLTKHINILGAYKFNRLKAIGELGVNDSNTQHFVDTYGNWAIKLQNYIEDEAITKEYGINSQQINYAIDYEMAITSHDILGRRLGLAELDVKKAVVAYNIVLKILKEKLNWNSEQIMKDKKETIMFLKNCGLDIV